MVKRKTLFIAIGVIITVFFILLGCFVYTTELKKTVRGQEMSPDGRYCVCLVETGEPDFPFGSARGILVLKEGKNVISETVIEVANDGGPILDSNWSVEWQEDRVSIIMNAEEAEDWGYILYTTGKTENMELLPEKKEE